MLKKAWRGRYRLAGEQDGDSCRAASSRTEFHPTIIRSAELGQVETDRDQHRCREHPTMHATLKLPRICH
jgi:hypothetical protein